MVALGTPDVASAESASWSHPAAFLNNTPVVAIMIPSCRVVKSAASRRSCCPLSFASILGGMHPDRHVHQPRRGGHDARAIPDAEPIGMFDLSMYGVPVAAATSSSSPRSSSQALSGTGGDPGGGAARGLPRRRRRGRPGSSVINQPVATLRGLNGLYLVSVQRGDMLLRAVTPEFLLEEGDVLHFTGLIESIGEVCSEHGLLPLTHEVEEHIAAGKLGPVAEDEDGSFGKVNASPAAARRPSSPPTRRSFRCPRTPATPARRGPRTPSRRPARPPAGAPSRGRFRL